MVYGRREQTNYSIKNGTLTIDASRLKDNERLELKYSQNGCLIAIQKIQVSLFDRDMDGKAETDIEPGDVGRVFSKGTSWMAYNDGEIKILADQKVLVIARRDLTLLVVPTI
jgi:NfeD-like C-terminal, partner-binding